MIKLFFFFLTVPFPEHTVSPFDLSQDWAQSPVGSGWTLAYHRSSFCSSWAFLRGTSFPPPWGSSPEHPSYILRSQAPSLQEGLPWFCLPGSPWVYICVVSICLFCLCHACRLPQHPATLPMSAGPLRGHAGVFNICPIV